LSLLNIPQLRQIEEFWNLLKSKVYQGGWQAEMELQLKRRINHCLDQMDWGAVQGMMAKVKNNLRKAAGQFSAISFINMPRTSPDGFLL